jgi:phosphohistidine phosphatase
MRKLYFFRHGIAEDGMNDAKRELTPEGRARTQASTKLLSALNVKPSHIYSSPLVRAQQTAELLAVGLGMSVEIRDEVGLGFGVPAIERLVSDLKDDEDVMFVGHEPDMSSTVSALMGGGEVMVKRGGFVRVDLVGLTPLRGVLVWCIAPKVFEAFAGD